MRLQPPAEPRITRVVRWILLTVLLVHLPIWAASSYAAWFQVYALELPPPAGELAPGAPLRARVVSSGRVWVDLRLELVQGGRTTALGLCRVDGNGYAGYDQRPRRASLTVMLPDSGVQPGVALLRAVATGRPQWTRTPPPVVRELPVRIAAGRTLPATPIPALGASIAGVPECPTEPR